MIRRARDISENDLHAWVDGVLDPERRQQVETWLDANPQARRRAENYARQNAAMHALFDPVVREEVPEKLNVDGIKARRRVAGGGVGTWMRAAAAVLLLAAGAGMGWFANDALEPSGGAQSALASEAVSAHRVFVSEVRHPVEVAAAEEAHLVGWLSKRFGVPIKAPKLQAAGYSLMGGRLLPAGDDLAAQFMYQDDRGQRLTLYVQRHAGSEDTAFRFAENSGFRAFYWLDGPLGYALVGEVERDRLLQTARAVYADLND
jgi:anti-sigma factor RsiW